MKTILIFIFSIAVVVFGSFSFPPLGYCLPGSMLSKIFWMLFSLALALWAQLLLHELGHYVIGKLNHMKLGYVQLLNYRFHRNPFYIEKIKSSSGIAAAVDLKMTGRTKAKNLYWVFAGGVLFNLLFAALAFGLGGVVKDPFWHSFWKNLYILGLLFGLTQWKDMAPNLLTDGDFMYQSRKDPQGVALLTRGESMIYDKIPFSEMDLSGQVQDPKIKSLVNSLRYLSAFDRRDYDKANQYYRERVELANESPETAKLIPLLQKLYVRPDVQADLEEPLRDYAGIRPDLGEVLLAKYYRLKGNNPKAAKILSDSKDQEPKDSFGLLAQKLRRELKLDLVQTIRRW